MKVVIGIDGGGTKTEGVIGDKEGRTLEEASAGASNYQAKGLGRAVDEVKSVILDLLERAEAEPGSVGKIVAGIAGLGRKSDQELFQKQLATELPQALQGKLVTTTDLHIALVGGLGKSEGVIVNSGTGAIVMGKDHAGNIKRADGWGYLLGDEGSGVWIGLEAIKRSLKFHDGRGPKTSLKDGLKEYFDLDHFEEIVPEIYSQMEDSVSASVAELSKLVFEEAEYGDQVARSIIAEGGRRLGETAAAVVQRLNYQEPVKVLLTGGVFSSPQVNLLVDNFEKELTKVVSRWSYTEEKYPPKIGALLMGWDQLGVDLEDFHWLASNFKEVC